MRTKAWHVYIQGRKTVYDTVFINASFDKQRVMKQLEIDGYKKVRRIVEAISI